MIPKCSCGTKTPDHHRHDPLCNYRVVMEIMFPDESSDRGDESLLREPTDEERAAGIDGVLLRQEPSEQDDGERCDVCGRNYQAIYRVPDDVWQQIAPVPIWGLHPEHRGGLLCMECAWVRAKKKGVILRFEGKKGWWSDDATPQRRDALEAFKRIMKSHPAYMPDERHKVEDYLERTESHTEQTSAGNEQGCGVPEALRRLPEEIEKLELPNERRGDEAQYYAEAFNSGLGAAQDLVEQALCPAQRTGTDSRGWKLVPVEPTEEMLQAADESDSQYTTRQFGPQHPRLEQGGAYDHYVAMLASAPESEGEDG